MTAKSKPVNTETKKFDRDTARAIEDTTAYCGPEVAAKVEKEATKERKKVAAGKETAAHAEAAVLKRADKGYDDPVSAYRANGNSEYAKADQSCC